MDATQLVFRLTYLTAAYKDKPVRILRERKDGSPLELLEISAVVDSGKEFLIVMKSE